MTAGPRGGRGHEAPSKSSSGQRPGVCAGKDCDASRSSGAAIRVSFAPRRVLHRVTSLADWARQTRSRWALQGSAGQKSSNRSPENELQTAPSPFKLPVLVSQALRWPGLLSPSAQPVTCAQLTHRLHLHRQLRLTPLTSSRTTCSSTHEQIFIAPGIHCICYCCSQASSIICAL